MILQLRCLTMTCKKDPFNKIFILIYNLDQKIDNATLPVRRAVSFAPLHIRNHLL